MWSLVVCLGSVCGVTAIAPVLFGSVRPETFYVRLSPSSPVTHDAIAAQLIKDIARSRSRQTSGHLDVGLPTSVVNERSTDIREKDGHDAGMRSDQTDDVVVRTPDVTEVHPNATWGVTSGRVDGGKKPGSGDVMNRSLNHLEETSGGKNNSFLLLLSNETFLTDADNDTVNDLLATWDETENGVSNIFNILHDMSRIQFSWIDIILSILCTVAIFLLCVNVAILVRYCRKHRQFSLVFTATSSGGRRHQNLCHFNDSLQIQNEKMLCRRPCLGWGNCRKFTTNVALPGIPPLSPVASVSNSSVDHMIANFVSDELIGELNDRDSACTSVSDGFVFSRSYGSQRSYSTAATIL